MLWRSLSYFNRQKVEITNDHINIGISIIIPVRNEAKTIEACILSIQKNNASNYQLIVVDDHSTDNTAQIVGAIANCTLITNEGQGKKAAIATGVKQAEYPYILATDGDTVVGPQWINIHRTLLRQNDLVTGLVKYDAPMTYVGRFQVLDNLATMCLTAAGIGAKHHYLANGANMSYTKQLYHDGQSHGHDYASGDDVFLIHHAAKGDKNIAFLNSLEGSITTQAEQSWKSLWQQRKRWASKTRGVDDRGIYFVGGLPFGIGLLALLGILGSMILSNFGLIIVVLMALLLKISMDAYFLRQANKTMRYDDRYFDGYLISSLIYMAYIIVVGVYAMNPGRIEWKGRASQ
jgi:glycosyltransferase involved in cell wall biosynthesis